MAENAAAKSMEQMEQLKKILMQLNQTNEVQVVNMIQDSIKVMDAQHQVLFQELQDVKAQLSAMQESLNHLDLRQQQKTESVRVNTSIKQLFNSLEKNVSRLGNYLSHMKKGMEEKAAGIVKNFKAHGIIALDNIAGKLGVKEAFQKAEKCFNEQAGEIQKAIDTIDTISHEVSEVKTHKENIGRALFGKELKEVPTEQSKFFTRLKEPFTKCLKRFINCSNKAHDMVVNLEKLEIRALDAKQSVLGKLDNFKEEQAKQSEQLQQSEQSQDKQDTQTQNKVDIEKNDKENPEQSAEESHKEQEEKKPAGEQSAEQPQDKQGKNTKEQDKTNVHDSLDRNKSKLEQEQKPQNLGDKQKKHEERAER